MNSTPFFRPMLGSFAITATAIIVIPMCAKAQTASPATRCDAPAAKAHSMRLGHLLSAARNAGVGQLLGGGRGASLVGAIANTAIEAASQSQTEGDRHGATAACAPSAE